MGNAYLLTIIRFLSYIDIWIRPNIFTLFSGYFKGTILDLNTKWKQFRSFVDEREGDVRLDCTLDDKVKERYDSLLVDKFIFLIQPGVEGRVKPSTTRVGNMNTDHDGVFRLIHTFLLTVFNII